MKRGVASTIVCRVDSAASSIWQVFSLKLLRDAKQSLSLRLDAHQSYC
jgi:hypothetical protein